ncbi:CRISPR-associated helicase Cas3' [Paenibacillus larvae subsp. larvae]|uniref:CRISPR-associated helicase Cas3' n=1 Tax=Paenibacillus larvae TaxID=1464 RepID=UPI0023A9DCEA|nr:CRISPR-associated helicase Cas3' [Paenibacillus larvae]MDE5140102.1 CRISPR-associated helicase Cas3' [Paenibacillus larvae subsp. larvae]
MTVTYSVSIRTWMVSETADLLWAHTPQKGQNAAPETLIQHSELVMQFAQQLMGCNGVNSAIERALDRLKIDSESLDTSIRERIRNYFIQAIYLHDLGKVNPAYQRVRLRNEQMDEMGKFGDSHHSLLSALLYLHIHLRELRSELSLDPYAFSPNRKLNRRMYKFLRHVLYTFAYVISRHHTCLTYVEERLGGQFTEFESKLSALHERIIQNPEYVHFYKYKKELIEETSLFNDIIADKRGRLNHLHSAFPFYILVKLLYSTLVASDFRAAYAYLEGKSPRFHYFGEDLPIHPMIKAYRNTPVYQGIEQFRKNPESTKISPINRLRSALFDETENRLLEQIQENVFYLEAPTGSGKTNMSIHLALQLLNSNQGLNKLIYIFPFNSLIEQTKETLDRIFDKPELGNYRVEVINSITPMVTKAEAEGEQKEPDIDYRAVLLQRQLLQYPVTLTSHVNFFHYLFGTGRESNLAFAHLCNSVIILDEIQSYRNDLWKEIIHFMRAYADILHIKFIIMSATLPELDLLMEHKEAEPEISTCLLVKDRNLYFRDPLFCNRVHLHFDLLKKGKIDQDVLIKQVLEVLEEQKANGKTTRLLIEFISKKSARLFYKEIRQHVGEIPVFELTGDDSHFYRKRLLEKLGKNSEGKFYLLDVIVVATQVIEAGVDIDMDVGFKDISLLDSEEQFLGRINRSCLRDDCHAYFFHMDTVRNIYRNDWRTEYDLRAEPYQHMLATKDFSGFYHLSMKRINDSRNKSDENNWEKFKRMIQDLDYRQVEEWMTLIKEKQVSLFLNYAHQTEDGSILVGEEVWNQYVDLMENRDMDYAERQVKLSQIRQTISYFTYTYSLSHGDKPGIYDRQLGSLYYVSDGTSYMETDPLTQTKKFNRALYMESERSILL